LNIVRYGSPTIKENPNYTMKKPFIFLLSILIATATSAQIAKIEHFNAHHVQARALFDLFKSTFQLPLVYDYQHYGSFSSGGLWLGNITLEFVCPAINAPATAIFKGVSLEPVQHTDSIIPELDNRQIAHSEPDIVKIKADGAEKVFWTVTGFTDLSGPDVRIFMCDYEDRSMVNGLKKAAADSLAIRQGGPLGIIGLKTIVSGVSNPEKAAETWSRMPGITTSGQGYFSFPSGPALNLQKAGKDGIMEIIVQIRSKATAMAFLAQHQLLRMENDTILIDPDKVYGLRIVLEE
jgi:hypothetical protein